MIKKIVKGVWAFCSYLFVPQWGRSRKAEELQRKIITNQLTSNMKENNIEKLPSEYREYVKDNIGVPKIIRGQQLFYYENTCHVNSILFSEFINTTTQYHCSVIEGIVVCKNGFAYEHCWNLIRDENGEAEYVDVTMEAIATDTERETEKVYYELKEYEIEELIEKIKYGQPLFTQETHRAVDEYYVEHPEKEAEYRTGKLKVDR